MAEKKGKLRGRTFKGLAKSRFSLEIDQDGDIALMTSHGMGWLSIPDAREMANYILALCDQQESQQ